MALWRDRLAEKQLLLVLDDAASSEQVRPLLPGAGGSLVLVTSRLHLSALEDATAVSLDTLPAGEAAALLVRLAGRAGLSPDDPAVGEIARLCGYLPLAIGMVARQLHHHPAWTAAGRAAELAAAVDRLELMATENLSVVAAFNLSYENLSSERQRLFRRLGLHPGTDADAYAAAALDGIDLATARRHLEALYDQYLLTEPDQGRYRMHDLIRAHAYGLAERLDPDSDRKQAIDRLLDYYQHTAGLAESRLARQTRGRLGHPAATKAPAVLPDLPDSTRALSWERAERANLLACIDHVTRTNQHARVVILTASIAAVLQQDGPWTDAATRHAAAVRAARHLNHQSDVADGLIQLGVVQRLTGDTSGAAEAIGEALAVYRTTGDRLGQAGALNELGIVRRQTGDYPGAAQALDEALDISRDTGDHHVQANILQNMGAVKQLTGDFSGAAEPLEEALAIYRVLGDQPGLAATLSHLGTVRRQIADYPGAAQALDEALDISRDTGDRRSQANALTLLGEVRRTTGDYLGAAQALEEALDISREMGSRLIRANCLYLLGDIRRIINDNSGAGQALEEALDTYRGIGDRLGQANSLASTGVVRRQTGDNSGAAQALEEALDIYRAIGDRASEAEALNETATVYRLRGDLDQAEEAHRQALNLARDIDSPWDMAHAIAGLARCALAVGHITETETSLKQALEIFQQIGAAEATDVAAELAALQASADSASDSSSG
jgi:tetratricopeptide (TPR) repeat protein